MLKQPNTNVKMTNVAFIKYKLNNKNFEIACYRNKAVNWRNGQEKDISEVLQINEIYENANHGIVAKKSDLNKFFPNKDKDEIIEIILEKGELQISDKEREVQLINMSADIAGIIAQKCVHPANSRHFTLDSIKAAMKEIHYPVKLDQPAKKQALECIKLLQKKYKIMRACMKIRITFPKITYEDICKKLTEIQIDHHESEDIKEKEIIRTYLIEPSKYRELNALCKKIPGTSVEVLVNIVSNTEVKDLEDQAAPLELIEGFKEEDKEDEKEVVEEKQKPAQKNSQCTSCAEAFFDSKEEQRNHYKSQWHISNVKRKTKGLEALTEQQWKIQQFNQSYK